MSPHLAELIIGGAFASVEIGKSEGATQVERPSFCSRKGHCAFGSGAGI